MQQRLNSLLEGFRLSLGVSRWTRLYVWTNESKLYMRLDRSSQFSVPLSDKIIHYLEYENVTDQTKKIVEKLANTYEFGQEYSEEDLEKLVKIIEPLEDKPENNW